MRVAVSIVLTAAALAAACESMEDAAAASRELRERYGVEEASFSLDRSGGPVVLTVEAKDPRAVGGVDAGERLRGIAGVAAGRFDLAAADSVVVSLVAAGAAGTTATLTGRFAAGELRR